MHVHDKNNEKLWGNKLYWLWRRCCVIWTQRTWHKLYLRLSMVCRGNMMDELSWAGWYVEINHAGTLAGRLFKEEETFFKLIYFDIKKGVVQSEDHKSYCQ